ncbi:MAG: 2-hydroxyglutaryl-CoA dehydratase [Deltaproteobacteria bacterium]|nr:2-hydroxyglutaryl-CoA dehydratase [Deltaproteobacteria bacterium]
MLHAGLDIGSLWTKAVVLGGGAVAGWHVMPTGESSRDAARTALEAALGKAKAVPDDLSTLGATGAGKGEVERAAHQASEVLCAARGIHFLHPEARGVIDIGGESTRAVKLDADGNVLEFAKNDKCASGTGIFLDAMAKLMGLSLREMGPLSLTSTADVHITSTCVVFAESEVVSQIHRQTPRQDILRGIHRSVAVRVHGLANRVDLEGPSTAAIGGLALNTGILHCLRELMGGLLAVPDEPQIVTALGAALIASDHGGAA